MIEADQVFNVQDDPVELGEDNRALVEQLRTAERALARWAEIRDEAKGQLLKLLDGHKTGTIGGATAVRAIHTQPTMILDGAKVKQRYPGVWTACQKVRAGSVRLNVDFSFTGPPDDTAADYHDPHPAGRRDG